MISKLKIQEVRFRQATDKQGNKTGLPTVSIEVIVSSMVNTTILSVNTIFHFIAEWIQCRSYDQYSSSSKSTGFVVTDLMN